MMKNQTLRLALIQLKVGSVKSTNINKAKELIKEAAQKKANLICLPECFNSPYGVQYFPEYAEKENGDSVKMLSEISKECSVHLIGGSIPEEDNGKLYNTSFVFDPNGKQIGKFRKVHLFDIDVPGGIKFTESDILSPGKDFLTFNIGSLKIGVGICYDIRFPELAESYAKMGCNMLIYPGAFNMTTGPKHWELLARGRANDHQLYTAVCSPARDVDASYVAWGHSSICNPWGEVISKAGVDEEIIYADIDLEEIQKVRTAIPTSHQKRHDIYDKWNLGS